MQTISSQLLNVFKLGKSCPPIFFRSLGECKKFSGSHPYSHIMRRAWEFLGLSGIYCIDNKPTIYFKEVAEIDPVETQSLQRKLWNQGFATILVVSSKTELHIYSGLVPPPPIGTDRLRRDESLVKILNKVADALEIGQLVQSVETGQFYQDNKNFFNSSKTVDRYLLKNLSEARDLLLNSSNLDYPTIHALLGRLVFTCYLVDRKIIGSNHFHNAGAPRVNNLQELFNSRQASEAKNILYRLFEILHADFNGNMFEKNIAEEKKRISSEHIEILKRFFNKENLETGQFSFLDYDFSVIPIETISAIYEEFLGAESAGEQKESGAYYTPKLLVETTIDIAVEGWDSLLDKKILDPACGSGIFLVILFNRMAEEWRFKNPTKKNTVKAKELIKIIRNNLCGIDIKETACRVTCFSLYLAYLDQLSPRDIDKLKKNKNEKILPNLLALKRDNYKTRDGAVVFEGNFFDSAINIQNNFDLIIGNPPWVSRGQSIDPQAVEWCSNKENPWTDIAPKGKSAKERFFMPQRQIVHAFLWKVPCHLQLDGKSCLLLPSKLFLNRTDEFQKGWFQRFSVDKVVQLSDMRFVLFEKAICPAIIVKFGTKKPDNLNYSFEYLNPKVNRADPRNGAIILFPADYKRIKVANIVQYATKVEVPVLWKKNFWGSPRDVRLIDRLLEMPRLGDIVGDPKEKKRWVKGQGFIPDTLGTSDSPKRPWWDSNHLFINANSSAINFVLLKEDCEFVKNKFLALHRSPNPALFKAPLILINQGFSKCAFCDFNVLFRHALQSISGPREDQDYLLFLTGVLNSSLAIYFLFHTSANWGTERDKVHLFELMRLPFPLPQSASKSLFSGELIKEVASLIRQTKIKIEKNSFGRDEKNFRLKENIEPLIFEYYGISEWERFLIDDTVAIFEPSSTPSSLDSSIPTLDPTSLDFRKEYSNLLCEILNSWAKAGKQRVSGLTRFSRSLGYGILTLTKSFKTKAYDEREANSELVAVLERIQKFLPLNRGGFSCFRDLKVFEGDMIHLVKPLAKRHWTKTSALNDADEIAAAILSGIKESE